MEKPYACPFALLRNAVAVLLPLLGVPAAGWAQTAPTLVSLSPARNAPAAQRPVTVAATFSQPLDGASLTRAAVRVYSEQRGGHLFGTYAGGGTSTVAFTGAQGFKAGETIRTSFTTALRASAGPALAASVVSQFTVDAAPATGTFAGGSTDFQLGTNPADIVAADLDGDGILDVALADRGGTIDYAFGTGTGQYTGGVSLGLGGSYTSGEHQKVWGSGIKQPLLGVPLPLTESRDTAVGNSLPTPR